MKLAFLSGFVAGAAAMWGVILWVMADREDGMGEPARPEYPWPPEWPFDDIATKTRIFARAGRPFDA